MIKLMYRPSFRYVLRLDVIHVAVRDGEETACGHDIKECKVLYNLLLEYPRIENAKFCKVCRQAYHQRDERKFPPIK